MQMMIIAFRIITIMIILIIKRAIKLRTSVSRKFQASLILKASAAIDT